MIQKIKDFIFLYNYYRHKKYNLVQDIVFPYWGSIKRSDIGRFKILVQLNNGDIVNLCLVSIEMAGLVSSEGLGFDIEFKDGCKYIRECTFLEFYRDYRELILYVLKNEEVVKTWVDNLTLKLVPSS